MHLFLLPFCRDCVGGTFQLPIGSVRQCSTQCENQTLCVLAQVPEEHLKVQQHSWDLCVVESVLSGLREPNFHGCSHTAHMLFLHACTENHILDKNYPLKVDLIVCCNFEGGLNSWVSANY